MKRVELDLVRPACTIRLTVVVDDLLSEEGVEKGLLPSHGLGLVIDAQFEDGSVFHALIDGGPSRDVLIHNMSAVGAPQLTSLDLLVVSLWNYHHLGAVLSSWKLCRRLRRITRLPPLPRNRARGLEAIPGSPILLASLYSPVYNERIVLLRGIGGWVGVVGCSVYGVEGVLRVLGDSSRKLGMKLDLLIGGFNLSTLDMYGTRRLVKFVEKHSASLVPLHSTSIRAREYLARRLELEEGLPGAGLEVEVAW